MPQVIDDRGDDRDHDAVLDPQAHDRDGGEQRHRELVPPGGQDAPQPGDVDELDRDQEDHRGQGGRGQIGQRPGEQHQDEQHHGRGGE